MSQRKRKSDPLPEEEDTRKSSRKAQQPDVHPWRVDESDNSGELEYEDPEEDLYEEEELIDTNNLGSDDENDEMRDVADSLDDDDEEEEVETKVFLPGFHTLQEGEELEYDNEAYDLIHFFSVDWPCLSFDVLPDSLGARRVNYPHTMTIAAGTQADHAGSNKIVLMKLSQLCKTRHGEDSDDDEDAVKLEESSGEEDDPIIEHRNIPHTHGAINRLRSMPQLPGVIATMSDDGSASIFNLQSQVALLDGSSRGTDVRSEFSYRHAEEGYALAWNPFQQGRLLTGDGTGAIFDWHPQVGRWNIDSPYLGHSNSVEDVCWSTSEADVFASASSDGTVKLWDSRRGKSPIASFVAHDSDVNVISWNPFRRFLLASAGDDGILKIWNLRKLSAGGLLPELELRWHKGPGTSIEWNPSDDSVIAMASEDDTVSIWDLSLGEEHTVVDGIAVPSNLLFLHQGQTAIKEVHWHAQIPGILISTAESGINVFKPNNLQIS